MPELNHSLRFFVLALLAFVAMLLTYDRLKPPQPIAVPARCYECKCCTNHRPPVLLLRCPHCNSPLNTRPPNKTGTIGDAEAGKKKES